MKHIIPVLILSLGFSVCQAQVTEPCDCVQLQGDITANTTLSAENCYTIDGCVTVKSGYSLTIPAGTVLFGMKSTNGALMVERGAQIFINGTSSNPVIMTSDQTIGSRAKGDWQGLAIAGDATNNQSNDIDVDWSCVIPSGGTDDNDNSGEIHHLQVHYAGSNSNTGALTLASVGRGTEIEHVQITNSANDGIQVMGGVVDLEHLTAYDNEGYDLRAEFGYRGRGQYFTFVRKDINAYLAGGSGGILLSNSFTSPNFSETPKTHPVFSNVTIIGPKHCYGSPLSSNYAGITVQNNSEGAIVNSMISGTITGLRVLGAGTVLNANNEDLHIAYNSFYNNATNFSSNPSNFDQSGTFCVSTIDDWMIDNFIGCEEPSNDLMGSAPGYSSTICNSSYCGSGNRPSFVLSTDNLQSSQFPTGTEWDDAFFDQSLAYVGAIGATDWTTSYTDWCPEETDYCPELMKKAEPEDIGKSELEIVPNPASGIAHAVFTSEYVGKGKISVVNKMDGQALIESSIIIEKAGNQRIPIDVRKLRPGSYIVKVEVGVQVVYGQVMVY